jgi:hypothetical protein
MSRPAEIQFGLICDDSRREDNGKLILIGVYAGNVVVPALPATLVLTLVVFFEALESVDSSIQLRVTLDTETIAEGEAKIKMDAGSTISTFSGIPVALQRTGLLSFQIRMSSEEGWETVKSLPVTQRTA